MTGPQCDDLARSRGSSSPGSPDSAHHTLTDLGAENVASIPSSTPTPSSPPRCRPTTGGGWRWMPGYLKRHQRMLGGLYQSVLRAELTHRYGVGWEPIVNGQAEIAGIPAELLERVLEADRADRRARWR